MSNQITAIKEIEAAIDQLDLKLLQVDNTILKISKDAREASKGFVSVKLPKDVDERLRKSAQFTEQLNAQIKEQDRLEKALISTIEKRNMATESTARAVAREKFELQETNKRIKEAAILSSTLATEYQKQQIQLNQLIRKRQDLALKEKLGIQLTKEEVKELRNLTAEIKKKDTALKQVDAAVGRYQRNVGNYAIAMQSAAKSARALAGALGLSSGIYLSIRIMKDAIKVTKDFEKANATLSAILQVEKEDMRDLTEDAIRLGRETVKTAGQVTELQIAYARLGFSQQDILNLTEATISGSIAMNSELDRTAELVGAVVNTFNDLSTTDAPEIIDIMSLATAKSALNFEKLATGIPIVAGAANAAGIPFTRLVALLGKLSDSGIDVSTSATALRNIFIEAAAQGKNYEEILEDIKAGSDKLTASNDEFGKRAAVSAAILSKNIDATKELDEALQGAAGTAQRMAEKELNTLDGALQLLRSAWEGYILDLNDSTDASSSLKNTIQFLAENLEEIINTVIFLGKAWLTYKAAVMIARIQTSLMNKQLAIQRVVALEAAKGVAKSTLTWRAFTNVLKANALFLAVTALAALATAVSKLNKPLSEVADNTHKTTQEFLKQREVTQDLIEENESLIERYEELKGKTELNKKEQAELNGIIEKLIKNVPDAATEFDEYGRVVGISTDKVRDFTKAQRELLQQQNSKSLQENKEILSELQKQQDRFNKLQENGNAVTIQGLGTITKVNGEFKRMITSYNGAGGAVTRYVELKASELALIGETIEKNKEQIETTEDLIFSLGGEQSARQKAKKAAEEAAEAAAAAAAEEEGQVKIVQKLRKEIAELESKLKDLTKNGYEDMTAAQADEVKGTREAIDAKKKELDAILGIKKGKEEEKEAIKGTIAYYEKMIKVFEEQQKTVVKTSKEYKYFQERIDLLKDAIEELQGVTKKGISLGIEFKDGLKGKLKEVQSFIVNEGFKQLSKTTGEAIGDLYQEYFDQYGTDWTHFNEFLKKKYQENEEAIAEFRENLIKDSAESLAQALNVEADALYGFLDGIINGFENTTDAVLSSIEVVGQVTSALISKISAANAQRYDEEIEKNKEYYDKLLENEQLSDQQKEALEKERDRKEEQLNKKKREEQRRAAIFSKVLGIAQVGIDTAQSVTKTAATLGYPAAIPFIALALAQGAIQAGLIAATPIPRYRTGKRKNDSYQGLAVWGEEKQEAKFKKDGTIELSPKTPGNYLTHVDKDDIIVPDAQKYFNSLSDEDLYNNVHKHVLMANIASQNDAVNLYLQNIASNNKIYGEVKKLNENLRNSKHPIHLHNHNSVSDDLMFMFRKSKTL